MASLVATLALTDPALAQSDFARDGWDTIGTKTVTVGGDGDHVRVSGNVRYRKLRLCAVGRPIEVRGKRRNIDHILLTYSRIIPGGDPEAIIQAR